MPILHDRAKNLIKTLSVILLLTRSIKYEIDYDKGIIIVLVI